MEAKTETKQKLNLKLPHNKIDNSTNYIGTFHVIVRKLYIFSIFIMKSFYVRHNLKTQFRTNEYVSHSFFCWYFQKLSSGRKMEYKWGYGKVFLETESRTQSIIGWSYSSINKNILFYYNSKGIHSYNEVFKHIQHIHFPQDECWVGAVDFARRNLQIACTKKFLFTSLLNYFFLFHFLVDKEFPTNCTLPTYLRNSKGWYSLFGRERVCNTFSYN